jgi:hypothetical protein
MEDYNEFKSYNILDQKISLISIETDYGLNTIAEFGDKEYYYLGDRKANLVSAILAYCKYYDKVLSHDEYEYVFNKNYQVEYG